MTKMVTIANFVTESNEKIAVRRDPNGKYWNEYNIGTSPCNAGPFFHLWDALDMVRKHRPDAHLIRGQKIW